MATLHAATGNLDTIRRIVKLLVLVNSTPAFTEQHLVARGASELFLQVFGDRGARRPERVGRRPDSIRIVRGDRIDRRGRRRGGE